MTYHNRSIKASPGTSNHKEKVNQGMVLDGKYNAEWFYQTINNEQILSIYKGIKRKQIMNEIRTCGNNNRN
jgi:hypothetical protein